MYWEAKSEEDIVKSITDALGENAKYSELSAYVLGFPGSYLDSKIFNRLPNIEAKLTAQESYLHVLRENPNHIGCHTLEEESTSEFKGTHKIEKQLLRICAEEILGASPGSWDGYVASGGTEANIEAMWIFRNIWLDRNKPGERNFHAGQLHIIASDDTHYSLEKGANLLGVSCSRIPVSEGDRQMKCEELLRVIDEKREAGVLKFLLVLNMGSTNFGSVDDIDLISQCLDEISVEYDIHVDAAFGGFIYPFTNPDNKLNFSNERIASVTLDAHKMLQAPYGTGIFITRKNRIEKVTTASATYIPGSDVTVCGSRSGANAIVTWTILQSYGSEDGKRFCQELIDTTTHLCSELDQMGVKYYRNRFMNVVAIADESMEEDVRTKYHLVPDDHDNPKWWRVVIMQHVKKETIDQLLSDIGSSLGKLPR